MSLDFNLERIDNYEERCWRYNEGDDTWRLVPILEVIVWSGLQVGLSELTRANLDEWVWRMEFLNRIDLKLGVLPDDKGNLIHRNPTPAELQEYLGLSTNCSRFTRAQFVKHHVDSLKQEVSRSAERQMRELS